MLALALLWGRHLSAIPESHLSPPVLLLGRAEKDQQACGRPLQGEVSYPQEGWGS